ncbi:MAG TPA: TetR/AcrR family transcriptional regulator [Candidatus Limnocylindrales bacterium]|nr:TetR/AcrR family transcriptional regulator [Candidatus Limnocylindrales bacterium]
MGENNNGRSEQAVSLRSVGTRERLLTAAMELFAEQGYRKTTVGEIEARAGLSPRSGALYQYFSGKEDVLRAGVQKHIEELKALTSALDLLPLADLRSEVILLGRWNLQDLSRREPLYRLVRQEGEVIPGLLEELREAVHDTPHRRIAEWIKRSAEQAGAPEPDAEALAIIVAGSMGHYRTLESLYGRKPLDIDEERFLNTWVEVCLAIAEHFGLDTHRKST